MLRVMIIKDTKRNLEKHLFDLTISNSRPDGELNLIYERKEYTVNIKIYDLIEKEFVLDFQQITDRAMIDAYK
jgi:hypothetical protein